MVSAGETPDVVEMPDTLAGALCQQRPAREPRALSRQVGAHRRAERPRAGVRPRRQEHAPTCCPTASICGRCSTTRSCSRRPASPSRRRRMDEFVAASEEDLDAAGQVRLLPARRPGRPQRLGDVRRHHGRRQRLLQRRRHLDHERARAGSRACTLLVDLYKNGLRAEGQRQLGLQRDRRRLLFRHLRHARPGPGRADRHRRADEARRTTASRRCRRARTARPSRPSAMPAGRCSPPARTRTCLEADRDAATGRKATSTGTRGPAPADPQVGREGPVLCQPSSSRAGSTSSPTRTWCRRSCRPIWRSSPSSRTRWSSRPASRRCSASITPEEMANQWADYLTKAQQKFLAKK